MPVSISTILGVLKSNGIVPGDDDWADVELPGLGTIDDGEGVYATTLDEVFRPEPEPPSNPEKPFGWNQRLDEWWREVEEVINRGDGVVSAPRRRVSLPSQPPEPICAWYCPIHFFGHGWGIYIRENCILSNALAIAAFVDWRAVRIPRWEVGRQLLRSSFYVFFLHEQFHHKVESLGFRLLTATASDRYRPYKSNVYRRTFLTSDCIEESLANAESVRRLREPRYVARVDEAIREGLRSYLRYAISNQPPGYAEGLNFIGDAPYRDGLYSLQSQSLDGVFPAKTPPLQWAVAPNMITSLMDINDGIYVILPRGAQPIFRPASIDPGATVSSRALEGALTRHHGYQTVSGGKGSHVKLAKPGAPTIIIPGNRPVVSPGVVKQVLNSLGGFPLSRLPDLLNGGLAGTAFRSG
jgi:hypothetical protein